jgi:hypothetical protein
MLIQKDMDITDMNTKPTPSPGHELCSVGDKDGTQEYCLNVGWISIGGFYPPGCCGQYWQKPVRDVVKEGQESSEENLKHFQNMSKPPTMNECPHGRLIGEHCQKCYDEVVESHTPTPTSDTPRTDAYNFIKEPPYSWLVFSRQLERELNEAKSELEKERVLIDECKNSVAMACITFKNVNDYIKQLESQPHWPAPISTADRLPKEEDANPKTGYVIAFINKTACWLFVKWNYVNRAYSHWLPQPPIPAQDPERSEADQWYDSLPQDADIGFKDIAIMAFNAGKESKK